MIESLFGQRIQFFIGRYRYIVITYDKFIGFFKMLLIGKFRLLLESVISGNIPFKYVTYSYF
jgi:hypothetical protein